MSALRRLRTYLRQWRRRRRIEREAEEEFEHHIAMEVEALQARGLSEVDARRQALAEFGGVTQAREGVRDARTTTLDIVWFDVRSAVRTWSRRPRFAVPVVAMLALGIGVTVAVASAAYHLLLRPLPVHDEGSLFIGYSTHPTRGDAVELSWPAFMAWRDSGVFDDMAAVASARLDLTDGIAEQVPAQKVTRNFFEVLGVRASIGRVFTEADAIDAMIPVVISDALWRGRFAADIDVVGRSLRAGQFDVTIIGVLPPGVDRWRKSAHMWLPIDATVPSRELRRGYYLFTPVGRLPPQKASTAEAQLHPVTKDEDGARISSVRVVPLRDDVSSPRTLRIMGVLLATVCLTWLVVCANLSNLLLSKGHARSSELKVRLALGASSGRIIRQLFCETTVLVLAGGLLGLALATAALSVAASFGTVAGVDVSDAGLNGPVLAFAVLLTFTSALLAGVAPAFTAGRTSLQPSTWASAARPGRRWSAMLVSAQIALGLVVLVGATVLARSAWHISRVDPGFESDAILTFQVSLPTVIYGQSTSTSDSRYVGPQRALLARIFAVPGVELVTLGVPIFMPGWTTRSSVAFDDGRQFANGEPSDLPFAPGMSFVGPGYFGLHHVSITRGREFTDADDFGAQRAVIINEAMAEMHWPGQNPLGRRLNFGDWHPRTGFDEPWAEVVGVVANIRHAGIDVPARPIVYRSAFQYPLRTFSVMVRTSSRPTVIAGAVRAEVRSFDPAVPMFAVRPLSDIVDAASADVRHTTRLVALLASVTVALAGAGVFSLLAYTVSLRRREMAIRLAIGATPASLVRSVVGRAFWFLAIGLTAGAVAALLVVGGLQSLLFDVQALDPLGFGAAIFTMAAVAIAAAYLPARRASRLNPVSALRD